MALTTQTQFGAHEFHGPHLNANSLPNHSGVYLITRLVNNQHEVIDVGESASIARRIPNHDRMRQWERVASNGFHVWTLFADETQRMLIEQAHRLAYNPVCGER
jgi:excinuclease UvrABC nuclease subunit